MSRGIYPEIPVESREMKKIFIWHGMTDISGKIEE